MKEISVPDCRFVANASLSRRARLQ